jgi:hypothetical protein
MQVNPSAFNQASAAGGADIDSAKEAQEATNAKTLQESIESNTKKALHDAAMQIAGNIK